MVQYIFGLLPPPEKPRDKSSPSGPWWGIISSVPVPVVGGGGGGKSKVASL